MGYKFSQRSKDSMATCDEKLKEILFEAIKHIDFRVLEGFRSKELQNLYYDQGKTKLKFPQSKHNTLPSKAVDIAPYPIDWNDRERFVYLAGIIKGIANSRGISIRWGGDWNMNNNLRDQTFFDLPHFELIE